MEKPLNKQELVAAVAEEADLAKAKASEVLMRFSVRLKRRWQASRKSVWSVSVPS